MAKLTKKQADILQRMVDGEILEHKDNIFDLGHAGYWNIGGKRTDGRTVKALENHGYVKDLGRKNWDEHGSKYALTDSGRAALAAHANAERGADVWTPKVGDNVREKETLRIGEIVEIDPYHKYPYRIQFANEDTPDILKLDELEPAEPEAVAAPAAVTVAMLPPFAPTETDYANAMKLIDQQDAEIARLRRELADAQAARDALTDDLTIARTEYTVAKSALSAICTVIENVETGRENTALLDISLLARAYRAPVEVDAALTQAGRSHKPQMATRGREWTTREEYWNSPGGKQLRDLEDSGALE